MAKHRLFCVPGTWEAVAAANGDPGGITPGAEIGMLKGITDFLNRTVFDIVYVNYPASFGPIPGGGEDLLAALGNPSYLKSRDMGVAEVKRLIGEHQDSFGLLGYSQGGAVVSLVGRELVSGSLTSRQRDCGPGPHVPSRQPVGVRGHLRRQHRQHGDHRLVRLLPTIDV